MEEYGLFEIVVMLALAPVALIVAFYLIAAVGYLVGLAAGLVGAVLGLLVPLFVVGFGLYTLSFGFASVAEDARMALLLAIGAGGIIYVGIELGRWVYIDTGLLKWLRG